MNNFVWEPFWLDNRRWRSHTRNFCDPIYFKIFKQKSAHHTENYVWFSTLPPQSVSRFQILNLVKSRWPLILISLLTTFFRMQSFWASCICGKMWLEANTNMTLWVWLVRICDTLCSKNFNNWRINLNYSIFYSSRLFTAQSYWLSDGCRNGLNQILFFCLIHIFSLCSFRGNETRLSNLPFFSSAKFTQIYIF
jgi:hypothetical protein